MAARRAWRCCSSDLLASDSFGRLALLGIQDHEQEPIPNPNPKPPSPFWHFNFCSTFDVVFFCLKLLRCHCLPFEASLVRKNLHHTHVGVRPLTSS
ncbi:hypothetical protein ACLKA6_019340 [Drosophila palustris]